MVPNNQPSGNPLTTTDDPKRTRWAIRIIRRLRHARGPKRRRRLERKLSRLLQPAPKEAAA
jgi:hypothetical protein